MKKKIIIISFIIILLTIISYISYQIYDFYKTSPEITLIGDNIITLNLGEEYTELGATSHFKEENTTSSITIEGEVNSHVIGSYEITYKTKNNRNKKETSIKRTINVIDNINPEITLQGNENISLYVNDSYNEPGYTAFDNYDGDITDQVTIEGYVDTTKTGTYELTYHVQDSSNNSTSCQRTINIKNKPVITPVSSNNVNTKVRGLPVLMYHFFYDSTKGEKGNDANWMDVVAFEEQMKYLSDNDYYFPTWQEVEDFVKGNIVLPDKSIVITVDDGDVTFLEKAIPVINKYNVKATSFAVTSWNGEWLPSAYGSSKVTFESHSHDAHRAGANGRGLLVNLNYEQALEDVTKSRDLLGGSTIFCYPFGHYNDTAIEALKAANYHLAFTTVNNRVYPGQDPYTLPRVRISRGISLTEFIKRVE